jgi:hypothetical protein
MLYRIEDISMMESPIREDRRTNSRKMIQTLLSPVLRIPYSVKLDEFTISFEVERFKNVGKVLSYETNLTLKLNELKELVICGEFKFDLLIQVFSLDLL